MFIFWTTFKFRMLPQCRHTMLDRCGNVRVKVDDIIPYQLDCFGGSIQEDESFTVIWVERGIDKRGRHVGSRVGKSVFDQLSDIEFDLLMRRMCHFNKHHS
jgi:hypothetical protein